MSPRLHLRPEAENDLVEAHSWHAEQELGSQFLRAMDEALVRLQQLPKMHPVVHESIRRALVKRFPYAIFYLFEEDMNAIVVLAIMHQSCDPSRWQRRG